VIFLVAILLVLNLVSYGHFVRFDLTSWGEFTLSDQTVTLIRSLQDDLHVYYFDKMEDESFKDLVKEYTFKSDRIHYRFVDPDESPRKATLYNVRNYGTAVLQYGERSETIENLDEESLTRGILKMTSGEKPVVFFLEGHGERELQDESREGYSGVQQSLSRQNYDAQSLFLMGNATVPQDCSILVIAGPRKELMKPEIAAIEKFLHRGGDLLLMIDPHVPSSTLAFADKWGVAFRDDIVVDVSGAGQLLGADEYMPLAMKYDEFHPITENFTLATVFPLSRTVEFSEMEETGGSTGEKELMERTILIETGENSWAETNVDEMEDVRFEEDTDRKGPVPLGVAVSWRIMTGTGDTSSGGESEAREARIVAMGDSDFISNATFGFSGNLDFFHNVIAWLAEEDELISIRPRSPDDTRISLTSTEGRLLFYTVQILLPLIVLSTGILVWRRRR
jgi:ABC-type uncharacterized transport system involved in gliding motility auxiliary subunit